MTATHNPAAARNTRKAKDGASSARAKTRNGKHLDGSRDRYSRRIERFLQGKKWKKARALIQDELVYEPTDHWLWLSLGLTYYEEKDYDRALRCSEWAVRLESRCPLALWHLAGALYMTGDEAGAVAVWTGLLHMEIEEVAYGEHGEGMDWALRLVNDVHYRLGRCYQHLGENRLAAAAFGKYLHNRRHGVDSAYDASEAETLLGQVAEAAS